MLQDFMQIPFHRPDLPKDFNLIIPDSIRSGWLTTGNQVQKFEEELRTYLGCKHVVALNSCTAGLHLGLAANRFGKGDKFIVPTFTFVSSVECGEYLGMTPILVDSEKGGFNLDLNQVEEWLKKDSSIKAIVPVHYGGNPVDTKTLYSLAKKYGVFILEDGAHALESTATAGKVGQTDYGVAFSFYANKNLTTFGEGGAFATNNTSLAEKVKNLSLHGITKDGWRRFDSGGHWEYDIIDLGYKYNMPDVAGAFGRWQLKQISDWQLKRKRIAEYYNKHLKNLTGIKCPNQSSLEGNSWHLYVIQINTDHWNISRNEMIDYLTQKGIGLSVHYKPIHMLEYYHQKLGFKPEAFPRAHTLFESVISLPIYPNLTPIELDYIVATIQNIALDHMK